MNYGRLIFVIFVIGILGNVRALAQGTELFLRDDGSFNSEIPQDSLDVLPPTLSVDPINPPDLDLDGVPGLTVVKGPDSDNALHFQEWVSGPQPEQCFSGFGTVHLFTTLKDFIDDESAAVNVFVIDREPITRAETVIAQSGLVRDPWSPTGSWDEKVLRCHPPAAQR